MSAPLIIPPEQLNFSTLQRLVEEFVTRDGTDYGEQEVTMQTRTNQVLHQLRTGQIHIVFSPLDESCTIVTAEQWAQMEKA